MRKSEFLKGLLVCFFVFSLVFGGIFLSEADALTSEEIEALREDGSMTPQEKAAKLQEEGYDAMTIYKMFESWGASESEEPPTETPTEVPIEVSMETEEEEEENYLIFGRPAVGFKSGMTDDDKEKWEEIVAKYEDTNEDVSWNEDTNIFRVTGNFSSYVDEDGNINGWLYAVDGIGGYVPVANGKVMETGLKSGTTYCSPDGTAYQVGADGELVPCGTVDWVKYGEYIGPKPGYHYDGGSFWSTDEDGSLKKYDYDTAPDWVLEQEGYYRYAGGIWPIDEQYRLGMAVREGTMSVEEAAKIETLRTTSGYFKEQEQTETGLEYETIIERYLTRLATQQQQDKGHGSSVSEEDIAIFYGLRQDIDRLKRILKREETLTSREIQALSKFVNGGAYVPGILRRAFKISGGVITRKY